MRQFAPRTVVITGGTAGVGRATARAFAARGDRVAVLARGEQRLDSTRREIESMGVGTMAMSVDVADAEAVEEAADEIEATLGPIDVWVNNAMTSVFSPIRQMTAEEFRRVTEVTYLGVVHGTLSALRRMLPRDRGVIVQVGSALAFRGIPLQSAYCAAKHAIVGFTDSLRSELIHDGSNVRVREAHLPAVNTPQFEWVRSRLPKKAQPVPPIYQPEVVAEAIEWLSRHDRRHLLIGIPTVKTVWGNRLAPGFLDHYLADNAYEGQQTDEPEPPDRPDNLWEPAPGDWAAHGRFDSRARTVSPQFELSRHRTLAALLLGGVAAGALVAAAKR